jgi:glycosyltransferase involved in cell wall biosynthesis
VRGLRGLRRLAVKVLVDATMLDGRPSGAATRLAALGAAHAARGRVDVLHLVRPGLDPLPGLSCLPLARADTPLRRGLAGARIAALASEQGAALFQAGALPLPRAPGLPMLLTLHDLRALSPDEQGGLARKLWARHRLGPNLARAARVVAVSRTTADELRARDLIAADRVAVVPNAATPGLQPNRDPDALGSFRQHLGLNARYVLAIGPVVRRKRPGFLLEALAAARALPGGEDLALVFAGRVEPSEAGALARRAESLGVQQAVRVTDEIEDDVLSVALTACDALVSACVTEGFAIPVVDAQRFGRPVVAVRAGALPEVGGDAIWSAAPDDCAGFARALVDAVTPSPERDARLESGRQAAERWSWDASAAALEALWDEVAAEAGS